MLLKLLHITLAMHLLLTTTGVMVFEHLCQMQGRSASVLVRAGGCCRKKTAPKTTCHQKKCCQKRQPTKGISKKPCCEDRSQYVQSGAVGMAFQPLPMPSFKFQPLAVPTFLSIGLVGILPFSQKILRFYRYKPPPLVSDIPVLVQAFRC